MQRYDLARLRNTGGLTRRRSARLPIAASLLFIGRVHCRPGCRAVNITKGQLEGLFADELALLQTPGYMRLLKESVLQIGKARKAALRDELALARIDRHSGQLEDST